MIEKTFVNIGSQKILAVLLFFVFFILDFILQTPGHEIFHFGSCFKCHKFQIIDITQLLQVAVQLSIINQSGKTNPEIVKSNRMAYNIINVNIAHNLEVYLITH